MGVRSKAANADLNSSSLTTHMPASDANSENGVDGQPVHQYFSTILKRSESNPMSRKYGPPVKGKEVPALPPTSMEAEVQADGRLGANEFSHAGPSRSRTVMNELPPVDADNIHSSAPQQPVTVFRPRPRGISRIPSAEIILNLPKLMYTSPSSVFSSSTSQFERGDVESTATIDTQIRQKSLRQVALSKKPSMGTLLLERARLRFDSNSSFYPSPVGSECQL